MISVCKRYRFGIIPPEQQLFGLSEMCKFKIKFIFNQSTEFDVEKLHNLTKPNWNTSRDNRGDVIFNH